MEKRRGLVVDFDYGAGRAHVNLKILFIYLIFTFGSALEAIDTTQWSDQFKILFWIFMMINLDAV